MKKITILFNLCLILLLSDLNAQNVRKFMFDFRGDSLHFLEYKPASHDNPGNTKKYPLIIFLHGIGEKNNLSTGLTQLESQGLPKVIRNGHKMNFTWNGVTDTFLVLSPMCRYSRPDTPNIGIWPADYIVSMINYANANLRVDTNRIYLTGLSFGGGGTLRWLSLGLANAKKLAAAASVCPPYHYNIWDAPSPNFENNVTGANLPFRSYHATNDSTAPVGASRAAVNRINALNPPVRALLTEWPDGGHFIWDRVYDTNLTSGGYDGIVTVYEWFLGQNKSLAANILPVARAGNDTTILTSSGTANLKGSMSTDADGTIVRYVWKKVSGPTAGTILTPFGSASTTTVSGLTTAGVYKYELNVVDNRAAVAKDTIAITVTTAASGPHAVTMVPSGRITTGDVTQLKNASKFTLEAQFRYDSTVSGYTTIIRKSTSLTDRIMLHVGPGDNAIYVMVGNGVNSYGYTAANTVSPGTWYHVAAVFDGTQSNNANRLKLYLDGVQQTLTFSGTIPAATSTTNSAQFMAGGEPSCCYVNGTIDEIRVWNTALSASTITTWKDKLLRNCHPDFANLVLYWPLDNNASSSTATAALGTSYTGTITNGTYVLSARSTDTTGCAPTNAVTLSPSGRITAGDVTQLKNASKFTLEALFKYDSTVSGYTTIIRKSTSLTDRIMVHIGPNNNSIHLVVANGVNTYGVSDPDVVSPGNWYHIAAVFDGTQSGNANRLKLYIDGVQQPLTYSSTGIPASTSNTNTAPFIAGGEPSCCYLNGTIDEVRVWSTALSDTTINGWKDKLLGSCHPNIANLVLYWPLNNNANPSSATAELGTAYGGVITNGSYVISDRATIANGCSFAKIAVAGREEQTYGIHTYGEQSYGKVYPNPANGTVQIDFNAPVDRSVIVSIADLSGRYLYSNRRSVVKGYNKISLNVASLPQGTYIILIGDSKTILQRYKVLKR